MAERISEPPPPEPPPLTACTLEAADFKARLVAIAALNSAALLNHRSDDLWLELVYAAAAREQVLEVVRSEQACCAFLTFEVREDSGSVRVLIEAPEAAHEAAGTVFELLRSKAPSQVGCSCCGVAP